jgi:hypothetical protein
MGFVFGKLAVSSGTGGGQSAAAGGDHIISGSMATIGG